MYKGRVITKQTLSQLFQIIVENSPEVRAIIYTNKNMQCECRLWRSNFFRKQAILLVWKGL